MVAHTFNSRTWEAEVGLNCCEFKASLVYRMSFRTGSKGTEKPCLRKQKQTKKNKLLIYYNNEDTQYSLQDTCYLFITEKYAPFTVKTLVI